MCGRYVSTSPPAVLAEQFGVDEVRIADEDPAPNFNVAPSTEVPIVAVSGGHRVLDRVRWGLVPFWARDTSIGNRLINARAETVATKNAYRRPFERRRCLIPADGFYEWRVVEGRPTKQPYYIFRRDRRPLAFAGLWDVWRDRSVEDAPGLRSCVIITTDANEVLAPIHDRMPVVLEEPAWTEWLDPDNRDVGSLGRLLFPAPADEFDLYAVSTLVNRPVNNGPELLEPLPPDELPG